jgi:WhiB family transcriptional regulator, redox-sensing transcriptional regulator
VTQGLRDLIQDVPVDWKTQAACRGYPDDLFFPAGDTDAEQVATALSVCESCSVVDECLSYALESNQRAGIWGGTTERERRSLRRRWLADRKRNG